jgi:hypothetical protein
VPLINLVIVLIHRWVALYLIGRFIPTASAIKTILTGVKYSSLPTALTHRFCYRCRVVAS